jgi:hypothetical protein
MTKRVSLFKVLRRDLGAQISAAGFAEVPQDASERTSMLVYFRESSRGKSLGFWFQRDVKSYHVDALGSSFNLEFFRSIADPYDMNNRERAYYLLTPAEREELRDLQNKMIRRLPPLESVFKPWELETSGEYAERHRQVINEPFNPLHDVWMRFRDEQDLVSWTSFIGRILPALIERFEVARP